MPEDLMPLSNVKGLLETEEGKRELSYEQRLALQHADHFVVLEDGKEKTLLEDIQKVDERISEVLALKLTELLPRTPEEVRAIFTKERYSLESAQVEKIVSLVEEARS